jgi:hypothetical protein
MSDYVDANRAIWTATNARVRSRSGSRPRPGLPGAVRTSSAWIRLPRENGFDVLDLIEIQAAPEAETHPYYGYVTAEWARRWPAEEFWIAEKR